MLRVPPTVDGFDTTGMCSFQSFPNSPVIPRHGHDSSGGNGGTIGINVNDGVWGAEYDGDRCSMGMFRPSSCPGDEGHCDVVIGSGESGSKEEEYDHYSEYMNMIGNLRSGVKTPDGKGEGVCLTAPGGRSEGKKGGKKGGNKKRRKPGVHKKVRRGEGGECGGGEKAIVGPMTR